MKSKIFVERMDGSVFLGIRVGIGSPEVGTRLLADSVCPRGKWFEQLSLAARPSHVSSARTASTAVSRIVSFFSSREKPLLLVISS